MNKRKVWFISALIVILLSITACSHNSDIDSPNISDGIEQKSEIFQIDEYPVISIPLDGEASEAEREYSGLAWWQDELILLPQYPNDMRGNRDGFVYSIEKKNILSYLDNSETDILIRKISFDDDGLHQDVPGFEGFEAIEFIGDTVYLTIESSPGGKMKAFLVKGEVQLEDGFLDSIRLDKTTLIELEVQNNNRNASYEALTTDGEFLFAIFEQAGASQTKSPYIIKLNRSLNSISELELDSINFRITDASRIDEDGEFWMINYFFPGDTHLAVKSDPISNQFGLGKSHQENTVIERLLKFRIDYDKVIIVEGAPLYLELLPDNTARNWEGLVAIDDIGFLLVTDKFPDSFLGFIKIK